MTYDSGWSFFAIAVVWMVVCIAALYLSAKLDCLNAPEDDA
jgi:hypothetical protein